MPDQALLSKYIHLGNAGGMILLPPSAVDAAYPFRKTSGTDYRQNSPSIVWMKSLDSGFGLG